MTPHLFTPAEAETLIPRLTSILSQLRALKLQHDQLQQDLAGVDRRTRGNGHDIDLDSRQAQASLQQTAQQIQELLEQVHSLGCEVKGIEEGLIDFPAEIEGRTVYLCWKLGEETIDWWHDLDTGFAGRQPLPEPRELE